MKKDILVCVKMVPVDGNAELGGDYCIDRKRLLQQLNVADMAAVEAALRIKDGGSVTVLTMGTSTAEPVLRDLFARGVDRAVLLNDKKMAGADTHATSHALAAAIRKLGKFDLMLCGRRAIDGETGQVPGELAAVLSVPCITNVEKIETEGNKSRCVRVLENGTAVLEADLPVVISLCEYAYPLRLPGIKGRRAADSKQIEVLSAEEIGLSGEECGLSGSRTRVIKAVRMETGLRKGPKENNIAVGVEKMISMIRGNRV